MNAPSRRGVRWPLALAAGAAAAQADYPQKTVRILVGANAGGGTDIIARMLAEKFGESLKQPFVVENRPGASNTIAADLTAKAPADGYTLLVATNTGQAIAPHLIKLALRPAEAAAAGRAWSSSCPTCSSSATRSGEGRRRSWSRWPRRKPGELKYASSGVGSTQHIAGEAFDQAAGIKTIARALQGQQPGARRHPRRPGAR